MGILAAEDEARGSTFDSSLWPVFTFRVLLDGVPRATAVEVLGDMQARATTADWPYMRIGRDGHTIQLTSWATQATGVAADERQDHND
jgi:hypothetical protein